MSKIKVRISETKYHSFYKTLVAPFFVCLHIICFCFTGCARKEGHTCYFIYLDSGWEKIKKFLLSLKQGYEYKEMNFAFL